MPWPAGSPSGHDVFRQLSGECCALLEDPSGAGRQLLVSAEGASSALHALADGEAFLTAWRRELAPAGADIPGVRCLFYAAYEAAALGERLPPAKSRPAGPLLWVHFPAWSLCIEGERLQLTTVKGEAHLDTLQAMLLEVRQGQGDVPPVSVAAMRATSPEDYLRSVERVKAYIHAGDMFQANIARFWHADMAEERLPDLYARLRQVNPAPFSAFLRVAGEAPFYVLSASPERLFRLHADGRVDTRPIAGTRRRGDGERDAALASELLLSEKERAEHIMLVDLERNDLGRVSEIGSITVDPFMEVARYSHIMHLWSGVAGTLRDDVSGVDLVRATFPAGTADGCSAIDGGGASGTTAARPSLPGTAESGTGDRPVAWAATCWARRSSFCPGRRVRRRTTGSWRWARRPSSASTSWRLSNAASRSVRDRSSPTVWGPRSSSTPSSAWARSSRASTSWMTAR